MPGATDHPLILLVEDSEDDAFFFQRTLKKARFAGTCLHLENGQEAIDFLQHSYLDGNLPQMVFLDLKMPKVNGFEVLLWLSQQAWHASVHVVILSGSDQAADVQLSRELGAREFVVKPISAEELTAKLAPLSVAVPLAKAAA